MCTLRPLLFSCLLLNQLVLVACSRPRVEDPRLEWAYATAPDVASEPVHDGSLPRVTLHADAAKLAAVCRDVAKQAKITLIYPASFENEDFSGDLDAPADAVLDAIARQHDFRFQLSSGVGQIGKPLPGDRAIAAVRTDISDPEKTLQPLISESGKVTRSDGWVYVADRTEILQKVVAALGQVRHRTYAVQLLEVVTSADFNASAAVVLPTSLRGFEPSGLMNAQVSAAILDHDAYLGRTWTGVISEGVQNHFFTGGSEVRASTTANQNFLSSQTQVVQTGWHWDVTEAGDHLVGSVYQDATGDAQYRYDFSLPRPGLFLIHASVVTTAEAGLGLPASFRRWGHTKRFVWIRYQALGDLLTMPPAGGIDPVQRPLKPASFFPPEATRQAAPAVPGGAAAHAVAPGSAGAAPAAAP